MGIISNLTIGLGVLTDGLKKGLAEAASHVDKFKKEAEKGAEANKAGPAGSGFFSNVGKQLRADALEDRKNGERQIQRILSGEGVGLTSAIASGLSKSAQEMRALVNELNEGKLSAGDFTEKMLGSLPVIGEAWKAGRGIHAAIEDAAAAIAKASGASEGWVRWLKSGETLLEESKAETQATLDLTKMMKEAGRERKLAGLRGDALELKKAEFEHQDKVQEIHVRYKADVEAKGTESGADKKILADRLAAEDARYGRERLDLRQKADDELYAFASESERRIADARLASAASGYRKDEDARSEYIAKTIKDYQEATEKVRDAADQFARTHSGAAVSKVMAQANRELVELWQAFQEQFNNAPLSNAQSTLKDLHDKMDALVKTPIQQATDLAKKAGAGPVEVAQIRTAVTELDRLQKALNFAESMKGEADQIKSSLLTPLEQYTQKLTELKELKLFGLLNEDQFSRAKKKIDVDYAENDPNRVDPSKGFATAIERYHDFTIPSEFGINKPQTSGPPDKTPEILTTLQNIYNIYTQWQNSGIALFPIK